ASPPALPRGPVLDPDLDLRQLPHPKRGRLLLQGGLLGPARRPLRRDPPPGGHRRPCRRQLGQPPPARSQSSSWSCRSPPTARRTWSPTWPPRPTRPTTAG